MPAVVPGLPDGYTTRPLTPDDGPRVVELVRADEIDALGAAYITLSDVLSHWQRPSLDLTRDTVAVVDPGGTLIAFGGLSNGRRAEVVVAAPHCGRGIGTALLHWTWSLARELGSDRVGQSVPSRHRRATELLTGCGYTPLYTSWILQLPADVSVRSPVTPLGVRLREFVPGQDDQAAYRTIEDAFNEWPDRSPSSFGDWAATAVHRADFEHWQLQLAVDDGAVIGACHLDIADGVGWVNEIAVHPAHRGRGVAKALLMRAFAETRARGAATAELSTDTRTGALGLYLHVGMAVTAEFVHLSRAL